MTDANTHPLRFYDRSRVVTDWACERRRFWNYEFGGKGIVPETTALELYLGITIHDGLAAIAHGVDIDLIAQAAHEQVREALLSNPAYGQDDAEVGTYATEQATLIEGLLRGFYRGVWPRLREAYPTIIAIEKEVIYTHNGWTFMGKPDLVLGGADGTGTYIEFKSTSTKREDWINSWETAVQVHSTSKAIEATLGVEVQNVVVQGLFKGYRSYGRQQSPLCYAYVRRGNPPFTKDEVSYTYRSGFKASPVWEREGGVKKWVEEMPLDLLLEQFPATPPIFINQDLVEEFFRQREGREGEIQMAGVFLKGAEDPELSRNVLDIAFPKRFDQCVPGWGHPCIYRRLCFGPPGAEVAPGLPSGFTWREPHHAPEQEAWDNEGGSLEGALNGADSGTTVDGGSKGLPDGRLVGTEDQGDSGGGVLGEA